METPEEAVNIIHKKMLKEKLLNELLSYDMNIICTISALKDF